MRTWKLSQFPHILDAAPPEYINAINKKRTADPMQKKLDFKNRVGAANRFEAAERRKRYMFTDGSTGESTPDAGARICEMFAYIYFTDLSMRVLLRLDIYEQFRELDNENIIVIMLLEYVLKDANYSLSDIIVVSTDYAKSLKI